MIYKSIDTIPAKIFFKIYETGDVTLLCTENEQVKEAELVAIWELIKEQDEANNKDSSQSKVIKISAEIDSYLTKLEAIKNAVYVLKITEDKELKEMLKDFGYTYKNKKELERILLLSDGILDKVDRLKLKLPKPKKNTNSTPIDEMILSCAIISGAGFIDTNKITKTQLDALAKITESKIKASNNGKK